MVASVCLSICLSVWVCGAYVVHHCNHVTWNTVQDLCVFVGNRGIRDQELGPVVEGFQFSSTSCTCWTFYFDLGSYYNLDSSICLSVPHLLQCLQANLNQTWQEGWGRVRAEPGKSPRVSRHLGANVLLMMAENATFPSFCEGESQSGNPIGSELVFLKRQIHHMAV